MTRAVDINGRGVRVEGRGVGVGSAILDSAVAHGVATDYDGTQWVADVGPNVPDADGDPSKTSVTANDTTFDVVRYDGTDDYSQTTNFSPSTGPNTADQAVIYVVRFRTIEDSFPKIFDGGVLSEFAHSHLDDSNNNVHRINSGGDAYSSSQSADTNWHVYCIEGTTANEFRLIEDSTNGSTIISASQTWSDLTGITFANRADDEIHGSIDMAEYTILADHSTDDRDTEIGRLLNKYNI
jgi:hypothetical protein